ncbi:DNA-directed RNA polymerase subunit beta' [Haloplasma contractile]|uniref:DNA-directed RNA polymerase subunit beta' n=1 Tax=Haloplasma contractile SSD-17B TaxID=1033810 RepID=U2FML0_9MOLU|nr:DNA-directed RNA polymerase subunit beta' [Haloplasma contractile]ERJ12394.1 DNA-directed RNA polymerase subunit beta' protein [Haloplasma contractile SSD-17B]
MVDINTFEFMKIGLASPEKVREWSYGEVKKHETINYRTQKPEKQGLFCERIFGPTKDWECNCGKYKKIRYKGVVCDRCGVEVTKKEVRRERMGHIQLAAPVAHIWYFKGIPSRMGLLLDMSPRDLEKVMYFVQYVVIEKGNTPLDSKQLLSEHELLEYRRQYGNTFKVGMGAEAVKKLLENIDLEQEAIELRSTLKNTSGQKRTRIIKRLEVVESFKNSDNKPEWMIMEILPVIPPELRPMVQLPGGRFATSDLNDLYRRVINRNTRLKKLLDNGAPNLIVQNEKRMLQEAVDALIDNGRRGRAITGSGNRPLKSLSHMLKGKQGRFRQNLLGKRVDYSGRSVIVVGPELSMYQCGLPKEMAVELFKPFVIKELIEREIAQNIKSAKKKIERLDDSIWDVVEDVIKEHPVLLNRAPTLHRLGIQAFEPKLVEGRAIRLHPLVTPAFNADFDGDQMAVHVPLSHEAQAEARLLMLASNNILNPKDGKPVVTPSQDMVLGNYYITIERPGLKGEGNVYKSLNEAIMAYENEYIELHTRIAVYAGNVKDARFTEEQRTKYLVTTLGKLIFNEMLPSTFPYINDASKENLEVQTPERHFVSRFEDIREFTKNKEIETPLKKKALSNIILQIFNNFKISETSVMLDKMKNLGFKYSTVAGFSVGITDVVVSNEKHEKISTTQTKVDKINNLYQRGYLTNAERYRKVIKEWEETKEEMKLISMRALPEDNHIWMMSDSGARGNASNFLQLAGMRGLMANPKGETIELPIKSSFREGLTVSEFFISTHGARKGLADTALKTADSGYLTRRLVDVSQDVIIRIDDCFTDKGVDVKEIREGKDLIETLAERIAGRYASKPVYHPNTDELLIEKDEYITDDTAKLVENSGVTNIQIRNVLTCEAEFGVCKKCYGRNLATGEIVEVGEAVGVMAAQSIGEPGTQLTMRTFHTGGVAGSDITQGLPRIQELFEARNPKGQAIISQIDGKVADIIEKQNRFEVIVKSELEEKSYMTPYGIKPIVEVSDEIEAGQLITEGPISPKELIRVKDVDSVEQYILKEVQKVYRAQGVDIQDKHIEIILRQMLSKVKVVEPGDTDLLPGALISVHDYVNVNKKTMVESKTPATAKPQLLGITKAALETDSFLSAASFQETTRVLTDAAIKGKVDKLMGLKENVIIGKLIPAGTGTLKAKRVDPIPQEEPEEFLEDEDLNIMEI